MPLPRDVRRWPDEWRYAYQERLNIMEYDGRLDPRYAAMLAEGEVRRLADGERLRF